MSSPRAGAQGLVGPIFHHQVGAHAPQGPPADAVGLLHGADAGRSAVSARASRGPPRREAGERSRPGEILIWPRLHHFQRPWQSLHRRLHVHVPSMLLGPGLRPPEADRFRNGQADGHPPGPRAALDRPGALSPDLSYFARTSRIRLLPPLPVSRFSAPSRCLPAMFSKAPLLGPVPAAYYPAVGPGARHWPAQQVEGVRGNT